MTAPSRVRRLPRGAWRRSVRGANAALDRVETARAGRRAGAPLPHPPILIVGAPRSGSTLLYQAAVERFDVAYLSNLHCRLHGAPSLVERPLRLLARRHSSTYASRHGRVEGLLAPSECGDFWYRFFPRSPQYVGPQDADPERMRRLRAAVRALVHAAGRPVLFKNLMCTLRLRPLAAALPEALFVVIHRDLVWNAHSLLEARRERFGEYGRWLSAEPPEIERLRALPAHEQVVEQVRAIEALVAADREAIGEERFLDVGYEELCAEPGAALEALASFARRHGAQLAVRGEVPERFDRREGVRIDEQLFERLRAYAEQVRA